MSAALEPNGGEQLSEVGGAEAGNRLESAVSLSDPKTDKEGHVHPNQLRRGTRSVFKVSKSLS